MRSAWLLPGGSSPGQTREDTRLSPLGTFTPETEVRTRSGVLAGGNPFTASGAGPMSLQIGSGRAVVQGTDAQGAYPVCLDAPVTLTFDDGNAQFTRIDSVVARVYDGLYDTEGKTVAQVERITGEATAEPSPPLLPAGCLRLWDVAVPAGTSAGVGGIDWGSALTDRRQYTAAHGGIVPAGGGSASPGAYDGQYRDTGTGLERWSAADEAWQVYPPPPAGWVPYSATLTNVVLGNGKFISRYQRIANRMIVGWALRWASNTSGNMPVIGLPVPPATLGGMMWTGNGTINKGSGSWRGGWAYLADDGTAISTYALTTTGEVTSNFLAAGISMQAGGWIQGSIEYEVAG